MDSTDNIDSPETKDKLGNDLAYADKGEWTASELRVKHALWPAIPLPFSIISMPARKAAAITTLP